MTSLARQLQELAPPDVHHASKKRASLLFDPAEAADITVDTVYSIGLNGLEQLISIDTHFAEFETVLFHESFKDFERTVEAREVLEELDKNLELFLRRLSPYFLLRPTQKCLEWLIRVFKINRYSIDALIECVLPYYETKLFSRVVQLLSLKDHTSMWYWLRPVKKSSSPLSPLTLIQHCLTELPFLVFVCEMVPSSLRSNHHSPNSSRVVLSFYTSTVLTVLERANPVSEELTLRLIPYIEMGLKSKSGDFLASAYMIVSQLSTLVRMDRKLSKSMMELVSKSLSDVLISEGLCCLAVLTQTQELSALTKKTLQHLLRVPTLVRTLASISTIHTITSLLTALLCSLLDQLLSGLHSTSEGGSSDAHRSLLQEILDEVYLEDIVAHHLARKLLDGVVDLCEAKKKSQKMLKHEVGVLIHSLDSKYPLMMDKALEDTVASLCTNNERGDDELTDDDDTLDSAHVLRVDSRVKYLHDFVSSSLPQSRHEVLVDVGSTLVLSVHHPNPSVRAAAIGHLGKTLKSRIKDTMSSNLDNEFISTSLLTRLSDEDPAVISAVLELGPKVLFNRLSTPDLVNSLKLVTSHKKLHRSSDEWQECALKSLSLLMSKSLLERAPEAVDDVIVSGIPLLYLGRNGNDFGGRVLEVMEGSALCKTHMALKNLHSISREEVWRKGCEGGNHRNDKVLAQANAALFSHIGNQIVNSNKLKTLVSKIVGAACSAPTDQHHYITLVVVAMGALSVVKDTSIQHVESLRLLTHINEHLPMLERGVAKERRGKSHDLAAVFLPLMEKHADKVLTHKLLLLWTLEGICGHLIIPEVLSASMWLNVIQTTSEEQLYYHSLLSLFTILAELVDLQIEGKGQGVTAPSKLMLHTVMQRHFSKRGTLLRFLAMIWTLPVNMALSSTSTTTTSISPVLQARSLSIACAFLKCLKGEVAIALTNNHCPVVPSSLIPLASSHKSIRDGALDCLVALQQACSSLHPVPDPSAQEGAPETIPAPSPPPILRLVHQITRHKLQISVDSTQINYVLEKLHRESTSSSFSLPPPPPTPSRRKSRRVEAKVKGSSDEDGSGVGGASGGAGWLECIITHVVSLGMPVYIQSHLVQVVNRVDHVSKLVPLLPLVGVIMNRKLEKTTHPGSNGDIAKHSGHILQLFIECLTPAVASSLGDHPAVFQTMTNLMMEEETPEAYVGASPQTLVLRQLTPEFFKSLQSQELQQSVLRSMVDILIRTKHSEVTAFVKEAIRKLSLSSELVSSELNRDVKKLGGDPVLDTPSKRKRAKRTETPPSDEVCVVSVPWKRVTLVLELVEQVLSLVSDNHLLVPLLFGLLSKCLELDEAVRFEMEYTHQLILSCLINILNHIVATHGTEVKDVLSESQFNVEMVVQCVRLSSNPQTHHHALIFLSTAAGIFPGLVLHNIMPIFTFMGANILRQDDLYSFQVITQTIDTVIPPLIKSGSEIPSAITRSSSTTRRRTTGQEYRATPTSVEGVITEIIHIFVDAVPHIPDHRKVPLFAHLLETVGERDYLHVVVGLLVEKQAMQGKVVGEEVGSVGKEDTVAMMDASFILSVLQQFHPDVQIIAAFKLAKYLAQLPEEKPASAFKVRQLSISMCALFNIAGHTDKQLQRFKSLTLSILISLLSHRDFVAKVLSLEVEEIEEDIIKLLQCVLEYTSRLNRSTEEANGKTIKSLLIKSYRVIDKITLLLSFGSYLEVMCQLVGMTTSTDVQEKALKMLVTKLEDQKYQFSQDHEPSLLNLTDVLLGVAGNDPASLSSRKSALDCVRLIVMKLTGTHKNKIMKVMKRVIELIDDPDLPVVVRASCFACLGELCLSLGPHLIPVLPKILPQILSHLGTNLPLKSRMVNLQLNTLAALQSVIKTLPNFLSSFTADITLKLCHLSIAGAQNRELSKIEKEATKIREELATSVPARNMLPAYHKSYEAILPHGNDSVLALLGMLNGTIAKLSKEDSKVHEELIVDIFFLCLEYRTSQTKEVGSLSGVKMVEECCLDAFVVFVVKLSEIQFRPIFLRLLDWAVNPNSPKERLITFYHLADRVADKLKNLFLLFAGHMVNSMVQLLDRNHTDKNDSLFFSPAEEEDGEEEGDDLALDQSCLLLHYILQCLTKCFIYDKTGFLTKERFETILRPLVDQVTNKLGGSDLSASRIDSHLTGCIASFGIAAGKELLWKPLNYQLLLKTRHKDSEVRLSVLRVLQNLYGKLGEEFIVLLPETIPYLSELMEDECVEVEQLTQVVISTIENILGESIEQYF